VAVAAPPRRAAVQSPVTAYAEAVAAGRIIAGKLVRLACARHLEDLKTGAARGLRFDAGAAQNRHHGADFGFEPPEAGEEPKEE